MWYINAIIKKINELYKPNTRNAIDNVLFEHELVVFRNSLVPLFRRMENIYIHTEEISRIHNHVSKLPKSQRPSFDFDPGPPELIKDSIDELESIREKYKIPEVVIENVPLLPVAVIYHALNQYFQRLSLYNIKRGDLFFSEDHLKLLFICLATALKHESDAEALYLTDFSYAYDPERPFRITTLLKLEVDHLKALKFTLELSLEKIMALFLSLDDDDKKLFYRDLAHCEEQFAEELLQIIPLPISAYQNDENAAENSQPPKLTRIHKGRSNTLPTLFNQNETPPKRTRSHSLPQKQSPHALSPS